MKKDFINVTAIGILVGLLAQPILANVPALENALAGNNALIRIGVLIAFAVLAPLALYMAYLLGKIIPVLYQFGKFAAVGVLNTFVDVGVFNLETFMYGAVPTGTMFAVMKGISFIGATTNSFFWNKYWTFKANGTAKAGETIKFYIVAIGGFLINVGVSTLVFKSGGVNPSPLWTNILSPAAGVAGAFLWDFLGYKFVVFAKKK